MHNAMQVSDLSKPVQQTDYMKEDKITEVVILPCSYRALPSCHSMLLSLDFGYLHIVGTYAGPALRARRVGLEPWHGPEKDRFRSINLLA